MANSVTHPFTVAKLRRPAAGRDLVPRPHLVKHLIPLQTLALVLIPAGYGKTTPLSTWSRLKRVPFWLALRGVSPADIQEINAAYDQSDRHSLGQTPLALRLASFTGILTRRAREVLRLLDERCTDKEIAEALLISTETVPSHVAPLSDKLEAHGWWAIVQAAKVQGLLA